MLRVFVALALVFPGALLAGAAAREQAPTPLMKAVQPDSARAGDEVTVSGTNLEKANIAAVYLTQGDKTIKVKLTSQSESEVKFHVPADMKPGRFGIMVLTTGGDDAREIDEPYMIASFALTAHHIGDTAAFQAALDRLRKLERHEAGLSYWDLRTNTPFYGWGLAGRIETTAMVVRAFAAGGEASAGMLFLLRRKDRYGVWHSTQATVQVLNAILAASEVSGKEPPSGPAEVDVLVNGKPAITLQLPGTGEVTGPLRADLTAWLAPGANCVTVRRRGGAKEAQVQLAASYYVPWTAPRPEPNAELRLSVQFDRTHARVGQPIACRIRAERVGFHGYGMMLAEIGLPPGADVDRSSLSGVDHYDLLPDRIVAYLWPQAGGANFTFRFRPRFAIEAKAASSSLYDYYNPEAVTTAPPARFAVEH